MDSKKLALDAMLAALCAVLGYFAIDMLAVKVTFESLPVIIGGLMFGPLHGMAIGGIGTLIYQLLRYGLSYTTVLWMLPYIICGLVAGLYSKKLRTGYSRAGLFAVVTICEFLITGLNTFVIYIDSRIFNYYTPQLITGALGVRIAIAAAKSVLFGLVIPEVIRRIKTGALQGEK